MADAGGDQAEGHRLVAVHHHAALPAGGRREGALVADKVGAGVAQAGFEPAQGPVQHGVVLAAQAFADQAAQGLRVELEHARQQAQDKHVFTLACGAGRLGRQLAERHAHPHRALALRVGPDFVGIIEQDAALAQPAAVGLVAVLVEGDQHIDLVADGMDRVAAHADVEHRMPGRDGGGDGHERHDVAVAASPQEGEQTADHLDPVLCLPGKADGDVAHLGRGGGLVVLVGHTSQIPTACRNEASGSRLGMNSWATKPW